MTAFRAPKGTYDVLPPESATWRTVQAKLSASLVTAGYSYIETPVFEDTALFRRGVGESTDVVAKEMYTFDDKGGRSLTLRPEGTAGVVRAFVEHSLYAGQLPTKLWYAGPNFRYERPQSGRFRHFTQVGAEAIGVDDPALDAELIALAWDGFRSLGLTRFRLLLNTLGDQACRPAYREALQRFLRGLDLDEDTRSRVEINPLRVLDDKRPQVQAQLVGAPLMVDHLSESAAAHYDAVRAHLTDLGIAWEEAPRLVRGLDYYTKTTFEFLHDGLGAQSAIGGGGRYDGLSAALGGPDLSGVGWAIGVDRTVLALRAEGLAVGRDVRCEVYVVPLGDAARRAALVLATELRRAGVATGLPFGGRGLKGSMKAADRSGASYAVIFGDRDLATGTVELKNLGSGEQKTVSRTEILKELKGMLS